MRKEEDLAQAKASKADLVLLDAGQGSGQAFDWALLAKLDRRFALAGGLNLDNLEDAMKTNAVLLDVSGGVETDKYKDLDKIKKFINNLELPN